MNHAAVLDLEKAFDKVDRREILNLMREWAEERTVEMIRAMLGRMRIRVKTDANSYVARTTLGV